MLLRKRYQHAQLRRRTRRSLERLPVDRFSLRVARTVEEHEDAFRLVRMAYAVSGFLPVRGPEMRISPQHVLPESTVWIAYEGDQIVGTITVTIDSAAGLPLDEDCREQLDALRARPGNVVVEFSALAVVERCRRRGLLSLLQIAAFWFARNVLQGTHVVCGINPKAVPYHQAIFGFESLTGSQGHAELRAPVQGIAVELETMQRHLAQRFPELLPTGGMFHEHIFEALPDCIEPPPADSLSGLARWKLSRGVFQELFINRSDRLASLDAATRDHLNSWRSLRTLGADHRLHVVSDDPPEGGSNGARGSTARRRA